MMNTNLLAGSDAELSKLISHILLSLTDPNVHPPTWLSSDAKNIINSQLQYVNGLKSKNNQLRKQIKTLTDEVNSLKQQQGKQKQGKQQQGKQQQQQQQQQQLPQTQDEEDTVMTPMDLTTND
jgi:hypothetical protein